VELDHVQIRGAREHNLQSIDVRIPKKRLVVLTGVSGSGKSSLAFDTLFAEGQRRYVESLSAYARQFLGQMEKPKVDTIRGLSPTISIEQKTTGTNPRSTVGTITEIADYLRVLYARIGVQHCHRCGSSVKGQTAEQIARELASLPAGTKLQLLAPVLVNRKGEHREKLAELRKAGFVRLRIDGEIVLAEDVEALDKRKKHHVDVVVDRVVAGPGLLSRLTGSVEAALRAGGGGLIAVAEPGGERIFSEHMACNRCGISFPELTPQSFSFNSPQGMCPDCNGLGTRMEADPALVVPDESLTIDQGAIKPWGTDLSKKKSWSALRSQILKQLKIPFDVPWRKLPKRQRDQILHGTGERQYDVKWVGSGGGKATFRMGFEGVLPRLLRVFRETKS
jgi:excinuclease ABC subunit A